MDEFIGCSHELRTDEDYVEFSKFVLEQIERVKSDPELGKRMLFSTGMYDENGELKDEFQ